MISPATNQSRELLERARSQGEDLARETRKRVIEPIGEGLRSGADAAVSKAKGSNGGSRLNAPIIAAAGIVGAMGEFFLDPQSGRRRRAMAKDRVAGFLRHRKAETEREARYAAGVAKGAVEEMTPSGRDPTQLNDPALESKVESEIFRGRDAPKGEVNVSVEEGVVYLRGELESSDRIEELVASARAVEGVRDVENLLHLPGQEAPAKANGHGRGESKRAAASRS
jgi:osmotically-inducible protein OsmY